MAGSGGEAGCVPQGLKALTGPPVSSSPHIDCILVAKAAKGPNGLNFTGPKVILDSWTGGAVRVPLPVAAGYNVL